jgi:hypothetical protein
LEEIAGRVADALFKAFHCDEITLAQWLYGFLDKRFERS